MRNPRLAGRYAKSLLDLSIEKGELEVVFKDITYLGELLKGSKDMNVLLHSPVIPSDKKLKALELIVAPNISVLTFSFLRLLITKTREAELSQIITAFIQQYKVQKGIRTVKLTTATPLSDEAKRTIVNTVIPNMNGGGIDLETKVDPSIIGGFVLQTGDQLVDASISYDLKEIGKEFENNDFVYKIK